jgi:hypothetical protein
MAAPLALSIEATACAAKAYCLEGRSRAGYGSKFNQSTFLDRLALTKTAQPKRSAGSHQ